jgi:hypothetical protein
MLDRRVSGSNIGGRKPHPIDNPSAARRVFKPPLERDRGDFHPLLYIRREIYPISRIHKINLYNVMQLTI